jgi:hypothetical protein
VLINIRSVSLSVPEPFQPGHRLTAEEAAALNHLRAEQIKSNMRRAVDIELHRSPAIHGGLDASQLIRLQARVDFLSKLHTFKFSCPDAARSNLRVEALRVAEERLEQSCRLHDSEMPRGQELEQVLEQWTAKPEVIDEARMRLAEKQRVAIQALEELAE